MKRYRIGRELGPADGRVRQRQLAVSLIGCLGLQGAIRACRNNTWGGVLVEVRDLASRSAERE